LGKWVLAITFLLLSIVLAFSILTITGVIDGTALLWRWASRIAWLHPHLETYSHGQDAEAWVADQEARLLARFADLESREAELQASLARLEQQAQQLTKRENDLAAWEARLQAEEENKRSVQNLAQIYSGMDPADAARILQQLDRGLILQVLLQMDSYEAAQILIALPTNLAAALSEQLGRSGD
jgi:flagellar motility protein MotE (MotC chaperone)